MPVDGLASRPTHVPIVVEPSAQVAVQVPTHAPLVPHVPGVGVGVGGPEHCGTHWQKSIGSIGGDPGRMAGPLKIAGWHFPVVTVPSAQTPVHGPPQTVWSAHEFGPAVGVGGCGHVPWQAHNGPRGWLGVSRRTHSPVAVVPSAQVTGHVPPQVALESHGPGICVGAGVGVAGAEQSPIHPQF